MKPCEKQTEISADANARRNTRIRSRCDVNRIGPRFSYLSRKRNIRSTLRGAIRWTDIGDGRSKPVLDATQTTGYRTALGEDRAEVQRSRSASAGNPRLSLLAFERVSSLSIRERWKRPQPHLTPRTPNAGSDVCMLSASPGGIYVLPTALTGRPRPLKTSNLLCLILILYSLDVSNT